MVRISLDNSVFLISGEDRNAHDSVKKIIEGFGVDVLDWEACIALTKTASPHALEVINAGVKYSRACVVLLTGDDEARLKSDLCRRPGQRKSEGEYYPQPRLNAVYRAGIAMGAHQKNIILLKLGRLRTFSDISGLQAVVLDESKESKRALAHRLIKTGCKVKLNDQALTYIQNIPFSDSTLTETTMHSNIKTNISILQRLRSIFPIPGLGGNMEVINECNIGDKVELSVRFSVKQKENNVRIQLLHWIPGNCEPIILRPPDHFNDFKHSSVPIKMQGPAGIHIFDLNLIDSNFENKSYTINRYKCSVKHGK